MAHVIILYPNLNHHITVWYQWMYTETTIQKTQVDSFELTLFAFENITASRKKN